MEIPGCSPGRFSYRRGAAASRKAEPHRGLRDRRISISCE